MLGDLVEEEQVLTCSAVSPIKTDNLQHAGDMLPVLARE